MKKKDKITPDKLDALHGALKELRETLGFDEDDEMTSEEICTELDALADELAQIEDKAHLLTMKTLTMNLDTDGAARLGYALAFMIKMNADTQKAQLRFTANYIRKQSQGDER